MDSVFQSAPPRGGRLAHEVLDVVGIYYVSIRAPARGATIHWQGQEQRSCSSFNPRPRAGGDPFRGWSAGDHRQRVSIRAPARGATRTASPPA